MRDFPRHQEWQGVFGPRVIAKIDEPFIDDLGTSFRGDIAAKINIKFTSDLQVIGGPGITLRVEEVHPAAACDRNQGVCLGGLTIEFGWFEMHPRQASHDLEMAKFLGADIHQEILAVRIFAVEALDRILHRGCELAVRAPELFKKHISKTRVRFVDADGEHELLDVMIHGWPRLSLGEGKVATLADEFTFNSLAARKPPKRH